MTGVSFAKGVSAIDTADAIVAGFTPTNYTPTDTSVKGNLQGIDTALGNVEAPPSSHTVTASFGTSLTLGTAIQNTTGYNLLVNIVLSVTAATTATIIMGVGSTSTPTTDTAVSTLSLTGDFTLSAIVPNNYYLLVNKTGSLTSTNNIVCTAL